MENKYLASFLVIITAISGLTYQFANQAQNQTFLRTEDDDNTKQQWDLWCKQYGKQYQEAEVPLRYSVFADNLNFINSHNKDARNTFSVGLNQFADFTNAEFQAMLQGSLKKKTSFNYQTLKADDLPTEVDWRGKAVTSVKNQGQCGSCWAFSGTEALEGLRAVKDNKLESLAVQQIVDCDTKGNGCNGGLMDFVFEYVAQKGIETWDDYPYTGQQGTCQYDKNKIVFKNTGYKDVPASDNTQLKTAVSKQPVSVAIEADQQVFQFYKSGVFSSTSCGTQLDHGVLAAGYGQQDGKNYWIVKNSWGTTWGQSGYIYIEDVSGDGICGINLSASYPTLTSTDAY